MSPEPEKVREIARGIVLDHAKDIEYTSVGEMIADHDEYNRLPEDEFDRLQGAVDKAVRNALVTVSWPDEQPQDEGGGDDMQREMAIEIIKMLVAPNPCRREGDVCTPHGYSLKGGDCPHALARAFLAGAEPTLRKRQAERDGDVRAVGSLLEADDEDVPRAREYLRSRFADRVDALIERDAKAGGPDGR